MFKFLWNVSDAYLFIYFFINLPSICSSISFWSQFRQVNDFRFIRTVPTSQLFSALSKPSIKPKISFSNKNHFHFKFWKPLSVNGNLEMSLKWKMSFCRLLTVKPLSSCVYGGSQEFAQKLEVLRQRCDTPLLVIVNSSSSPLVQDICKL